MGEATLAVTREQVLAFRRTANGLDTRRPKSDGSFRLAAWAGLQDSMPRAALFSLNARLEQTDERTCEDSAFLQIWGPRFSVYVVAADDLAVFTLGRLPDDPTARRTARDLAGRLDTLLGGETMPFGEAGRALGEHTNRLRYAATTGSVVLRWDGARQPTVRTIRPPEVALAVARCELIRRYLHVFGPSTAESFGGWAGIWASSAIAAFGQLRASLIQVTTPLGTAWILDRDEEAIRAAHGSEESVRLLPSGEAYYLVHGVDRELLVPDDKERDLLWTARVWPGAILANGEIVGTWRRANEKVTLHPWGRLARDVRDRIVVEAAALPLPGAAGALAVVWADEPGTQRSAATMGGPSVNSRRRGTRPRGGSS